MRATMNHRNLSLPDDPKSALEFLKNSSKSLPVLVFKKSPRCEISLGVEEEFRAWLFRREAPALAVAEIDVIAQRSLARGLTAELGIAHESPQALLFRDGAFCWHASHGDLSQASFAAMVDTARPARS